MQKANINQKQKGQTNVKQKTATTILYTTRIVDVGKARVARKGKGCWDDFEMMGASNKAEGEYRNLGLSPEQSEKIIAQLRKSNVSRRVMRMAAALATG